MKRLVHYNLEGLVCEGPHRVWVSLGQFNSPEEAQTATERPRSGRSFARYRVLPLFRDSSGGYAHGATSSIASRVPDRDKAANALPVTVA